MIVLNEFAPKSDLAMLQANAEYNNLPQIGHQTNTAFPGCQINLTKSTSHKDSLSKSNTIFFSLFDSTMLIMSKKMGYSKWEILESLMKILKTMRHLQQL